VNILRKEIKNITRQVAENYHPEKVILYGSMVTKKNTFDSDIDMLIVKKTRRRFIDRISDVLNVCDYNIPFEPIVYTPEEIKERVKMGDFFIIEILEKGKILYEKE